MIPEFCVTGPGVLKFELATSPSNEVDMFAVMVMVDGLIVASAQANDRETPSNLSLIYRGAIADVSSVQVMAF